AILAPRSSTPATAVVAVRAMQNNKELASHLTGDAPPRSAADAAKKPPADGIALQFPPQITAGTERPYFLMGDGSDAVYLLRWDAGKGVGEASANGPGKVAPLAGGEATGKVVFSNGQYRLVIKRPLAAKGHGRPHFG